MITDPEERRRYQREWMARRRAEFFSDKSCVMCGSTDNLELDHVNPEEKVTHRIWSWARERREAEIAKCQVLCKDCHKEKSKQYLAENRQHGRTLYGHGCRCDICVEAKRQDNARRK